MKNRKKWMSILLCLLCALLLSTITEAKSKKVKYHTEVLILEDDEVWATAKFKYKLNTSRLTVKPASALKTDNNKIATISNGVLSAKKAGITYISYTYKNGDGTKGIKKIKLRVLNNKYVHKNMGDIYVNDYKYGAPEIEMLSVYYKKNQLCIKTAVVNNRMFKAKKFKRITWTIKVNGKKIAKYKFKNINLNIKPYGKKKVTFKFPFKKTIYDVACQEMEWKYNYYYTWAY